MRFFFILLFITVIAHSSPALAAGEDVNVVVTTAAGGAVAGTLERINENGLVLIQQNKQTRFGLEEIQQVKFDNKNDSRKPFARVYLFDGSELRCSALTIANGVAACQFYGTNVSIPISEVKYLRIAPFRAAVDEQWQEVLAAERTSDQIVVRRKNDVIDYLDGVLGDMTSEHVEFEYDGDVLNVKFAKIDGLIFFQQSDPKFPRPAFSITTTNGSVVAAESVRVAGGVSAKTLSGHEIQLPRKTIRSIGFTNRSVVFLSDIDPEKTVWSSVVGSGFQNELAQFFQPRRDQGFTGEPLAVSVDGAKREFRKGIAALSKTELTYRLAGEYSRFKATVGVDANVAPHSEAKVEIWADSKKVVDRFVRGTESAIPIDVDLSGVSRMRILVEDGEILTDGDYVSFCDARLLK